MEIAASNIKLYKYRVNRPITVRGAATFLSNILANSRSYPYVIQVLVGGVDSTGPRLFSLDPYGTLTEEKFTATGSGSPTALGVLEDAFKMKMSVDEVVPIVARAIQAAMSRDPASGGGFDIVIITKGRIKEIPMLALLPKRRITPGAVIPQMEMQFKGKTGFLYGCVVDMGINPMPVSGAKVKYRAGSKSGEVVTDEAGNFRIELPAGHCSLYAYREGYLLREEVMAVILPGGESFCKIRMRKKGSPAIEEQQKVLGIGIEVTGKSIQHKLLVEIHDPKPPAVFGELTVNGKPVKMENLRRVVYRLWRKLKSEWREYLERGTVTKKFSFISPNPGIRPGMDVPYQQLIAVMDNLRNVGIRWIELVPPDLPPESGKPKRFNSVRLLDSSGRPIPGVKVEYVGPENVRGEATSNGEGRFKMPDGPKGCYLLKFRKEGYRQTHLTLELPLFHPVELALFREDEEPPRLVISPPFKVELPSADFYDEHMLGAGYAVVCLGADGKVGVGDKMVSDLNALNGFIKAQSPEARVIIIIVDKEVKCGRLFAVIEKLKLRNLLLAVKPVEP